MRSVKIDKAELLEIVRANATKHEADYTEAVAGWKVALVEVTKQNLKLAKLIEEGKSAATDLSAVKFRAIPTAPSNYSSAYARAIRMLELSVEDVIDLEQEIFNQLVLDEWSWKHSFDAVTSMYKTGAVR